MFVLVCVVSPPNNRHHIAVGGGLCAPLTLGDVLTGAIAPGRGPLLEPDLGGELVGKPLVAGSGRAPAVPGRAQPETLMWSRIPVGSPPAGRVIGSGAV